MITTEANDPVAPLAGVTDRELARRLGNSLNALGRLERAARPNRVRLGVARTDAEALRIEIGQRIVDGRWTAWEALGVDSAPGARRSNGEGSIYEDKARARFIAEVTVNGRRSRTVHKSRADATAWLREAHRRTAEGRDARESKWLVGAWLDHLVGEVWPREGLSASTLGNHRDAIERWWKPNLGNHRLATLQPEDVDKVIGQMVAKGLSANTIRINVAPLNKALRKAVERGYIARNAASLATKPKLVRRREPKYLDPAEARAVLAAASEARFGDAIALSMLLGLRRGEVLGLCWDRVDLDSDRPTVKIDRMLTDAKVGPVNGTKTGDKGVRTIVLPGVAVAVLRRRQERQRFEQRAAEDGWSNVHGLVFTTPIGTPVDPDNFAKAVGALTRKVIGRSVNPHALRHTTATLLHEAGASMKVAQSILGHTTSAMTEQVYTHVLDEQHDRAAAALDDLLGNG